MDLIAHFHAGGFFMYFILLVGIFVGALIIERSIALFRNHRQASKDLRSNLLNFIVKDDYQSAYDYLDVSQADTAVGRIAKVGVDLRERGAGEEELQARMDEMVSKEISHIDKRTGFLAVFGNVATLLGLLGTVTGLISSFTGVASASPMERATLLGQGIAEALNSTAFGLIVAIPALVAYAVFQNKTDKIINEITEMSSQIYHDLLFYVASEKGKSVQLPEDVMKDKFQELESGNVGQN